MQNLLAGGNAGHTLGSCNAGSSVWHLRRHGPRLAEIVFHRDALVTPDGDGGNLLTRVITVHWASLPAWIRYFMVESDPNLGGRGICDQCWVTMREETEAWLRSGLR